MFQYLKIIFLQRYQRVIRTGIVLIFIGHVLLPVPILPATPALGQTMPVSSSTSFTPALIRGINIVADDPLSFNFIVTKGDTLFTDDTFKSEANKLIKYFLAALTIPEKDMWVNLSPNEPNRIIPDNFGKTEMGIELLG